MKIKNLTVKNFMSVGNATQAVDFDRHDLTLVLGENLDLGGNGSRNGTGKTTIINALSYAFYGVALTNIKKDNLINKTNQKNMLVSVDFEHSGKEYKIERGRKPAILKFFVDDEEQTDDNAQGDSRETQKAIEAMMGISHDMFKHIVALNTYSEPFLSMRANDQRAIIEQLLGITLLTEKAETLKAQAKDIKDQVKEEEMRITAIQDANSRIEDQIKNIKRRQKLWKEKHEADVLAFQTTISELEHINIEEEVEAFHILEQWNKDRSEQDKLAGYISDIDKDNKKQETKIKKLEKELESLRDHKCHACGQELHDSKHEEILKDKEESLQEARLQILSNNEQYEEHTGRLLEIGDIGGKPITFYNTLAEALEHKNTVHTAQTQLDAKLAEKDPYEEQIAEMEEHAIQEISYDTINELNNLLEHHEFLFKLLTNKDSFIRKKIIDQNLAYLNGRLTHYLEKTGLRHTVQFLNDLSVEITDLGRDLDFDNLSRGERNRLILSLSWAFRDVWESLYQPINLLFIDELIDSGMDTQGVENSLSILKNIARERSKSVWLVSHKEELIGRVHNTLTVVKENGFTTYNSDEN